MPLERVLYVEDEDDLREIARIALAEIGGLDVDLCASCGEAMAHAEMSPPDLILLNVLTADLDGTRAVRELRSRPELAGTPIVFVTPPARERDFRRYQELGAAGVIAKPFDPIALPAQLRALWEMTRGEPAKGVPRHG